MTLTGLPVMFSASGRDVLKILTQLGDVLMRRRTLLMISFTFLASRGSVAVITSFLEFGDHASTC